MRNGDLSVTTLLGVSISKKFIPSIANTIGTNMANYKIVRRNQFAYGPVTSRNGNKVSIALLGEESCIVSTSYTVFEIIDDNAILPEYLMMWFKRPEFDRYARFMSHGSVREMFGWGEMSDVKLPIPPIDEQREIVGEYRKIVGHMNLSAQLNQSLEEIAQAIYKHWFVEFQFPISAEYATAIGRPELEGQPYKSSGGETVYDEMLDEEIPTGWRTKKLAKIADMRYGKMIDAQFISEHGYPIYSGYGIRGYCQEYMYEEPQILVIARGVSGTGKVRMSPAKSHITNLSIVLELSCDAMQKEYLFHHLKNRNLRALDSGSAQSQITIADLEPFPVLCPPSDLQVRFNDYSSVLRESSLHGEAMQGLCRKLSKLLSSKMSRHKIAA